MRVAGVDVSSFEVTVVTILVEDGSHPECHRYRLEGIDSFDRARMVGEAMPGRAHSFWDDMLAVAIEEPFGMNTGHAYRVQGAVLSMIPAHLLVEKLDPMSWRRENGLSGRSKKGEVFEFATELLGERPVSQDAADAWCIARAMRFKLEREALRGISTS